MAASTESQFTGKLRDDRQIHGEPARAPFTSNWSKALHPSLAKALDGAWRKYKRDYSVGSITYEGRTIFTNEELTQAFDRMDNLAGEQSKPQPCEFAERVIQEMGRQLDTDQAGRSEDW